MKLPVLLLLIGTAGLAVGAGTLFGSEGSREDSAQTTYYASGQLRSRVEMRGSKPDGQCERFHADGSLAARGHHKDGLMEGEWSFFEPGGGLERERSGLYRLGVKQRDL